MLKKYHIWRITCLGCLAICAVFAGVNILYTLGAFLGGGLFVWRSPSASLELYWHPSQDHILIFARDIFTNPPTEWVQVEPSPAQAHKWLYQLIMGRPDPAALVSRAGLDSKSSIEGTMSVYVFLDGLVSESAFAALGGVRSRPELAQRVDESALVIVKNTRSADVSRVLQRLARLYGARFVCFEEFEAWHLRHKADRVTP